MHKILVISDNEPLVERFKELEKKGVFADHRFYYSFSSFNKPLVEKYKESDWFFPVNVKKEWPKLVGKYDLVISLHCKQLFPKELIEGVRCVNVHPGLNPYNRGWYPQVFSIVNGLPCGATIHEIDEKLDHGAVIAQRPVKIEKWDTSLTAYNKVLGAELELIEENMLNIIENKYTPTFPEKEGNLNLKKDFDVLCEIDLSEKNTFQNHINRLRALTHGDYSNAFFKDEDGKKIFLKLDLFPEE